MGFNGNCSMKPFNIALLLEKKQMLTRLSKTSSEFPRLKGFGLIIRTHIHECEVASEQYRNCLWMKNARSAIKYG